jgi:hypothetical protein
MSNTNQIINKLLQEHIKGNSTQNDTNIIKTYNMAEWIGLKKVDANLKLPKLLDGYIGIITITTLRAIITIRQWFHRFENHEPFETPLIMFPLIKRANADQGLVPCIKFFFNYGFYKFGLEFCLMGIVALIGTRLDFYSILYCIWLMILFSMRRKTISKIWPFFKIFAIVLLPLQYALVIALPTWLCIGTKISYLYKFIIFTSIMIINIFMSHLLQFIRNGNIFGVAVKFCN